MRTVVTGGAGFIGSALCRELVLERGETVLNIDKLTYAGRRESLADLEADDRYTFLRADVADAAAMTRAIAEFRPEAILHLAAETHVDRSISGPETFLTTNLIGTGALLQAALAHWRTLTDDARATFRFVQVSTDEVFGSLGANGAFDEDTPYDPRSPYSASKAGSDHLGRAWFHTYGLPVIISNCSNNYGPRQFPEKLIPLNILNLLEGRPAPVYGDGGNVRDWLHVDDHARALIDLRDRGEPGRTYAVGARSERTNLQVVTAIADVLDDLTGLLAGGLRRDLIAFVADRPGHDRRYAIDPSRIEREIGWRPRHDFDAGLRDTVRWYLEHRQWWEPLRAHASNRLGLPA